ncbi:MAG TPA: OadG-related small transporter subunit [Burkholderiales bacterium]|nr:OadG-related small transporter subunit [Burkholderiales bacterium]
MDKWSFGLTLLVVGISGTFITLWLLGLVTELLKKAFPLEPEEKK